MDAILYIRFSSADQVKGDSIKRQKELGAKMAQIHGLTITETLIDRGKSAYHGKNRAEGGKLYEIEERALRGELAGKVLIFEAMDRMSRQEPLESLDLIRSLAKAGITLCESSTGTLYDSKRIAADWTRLIAILASAAAAYQSSHDKSRLVRSAWRATQTGNGMKDGKGADPRLCPDWMQVVGGVYVERKDRADLIRQMFEMSATGYGLRAIALSLKDEQRRIGWPKGELDIRRVGNLLRTRRVLGEYQPRGRTIGGGREDTGNPIKLYPPIISLELFHEVQKGLDTRRGTGGRERRRAVNVLSHLCRCQHRNEGDNLPCGSRLTYKKPPRQQPQLTCTRYVRAAGCASKTTFRYQSLLDGILDHLGTLALPNTTPDQQPAKAAYEWLELSKKKERLDVLADRLERDDVELNHWGFTWVR
ncbi:MAG: recombinase family protein [Sphingomonas pseudosanguinis]|uniref:recombinase family protein n=1 Tax=Sphingomonas pseudosanguinis TaxID=413712 RepID=UPI00391A90D8